MGNAECLPFKPETHFIGINWGNSRTEGEAQGLRVWHSDDCSGIYWVVKKQKPDSIGSIGSIGGIGAVLEKQKHSRSIGTNACVNDTSYGDGNWGSVRFESNEVVTQR